MSLTQNLREVMKAISGVPGFDKVLEKVTLVSAAPGKVTCELRVQEEHTNKLGTLHGGLTATLVDSISTMALLCTERGVGQLPVPPNKSAQPAAARNSVFRGKSRDHVG
uniref:Acyl-CoA thioesterase 13 n=1 Tax=Myotis myotis TaxID=51298 RepID=A0A7J7SPB1_MYOMY|nr:acyl-CoA thioesterase 13 [Myotis myotis]